MNQDGLICIEPSLQTALTSALSTMSLSTGNNLPFCTLPHSSNPSYIIRKKSSFCTIPHSSNLDTFFRYRYVIPHKVAPLIQFFPVLALWVNKNWPPSIKVKKLKIFWDKLSSNSCKQTSLNAPGTENPLSHPILRLEESHFSIIGPLG